MKRPMRLLMELPVMLAVSAALLAADDGKEYLFTYLQTTGMRELLQDESTGKAYIVEWTSDSDPESLKTFGDALDHYITGNEEEGQRVYVRGHLGGLKGKFDGRELYEFTMMGWSIVVPFPITEVVGKEIVGGQAFDNYGKVTKHSLREIGLNTYQWKGETRSYAPFERRVDVSGNAGVPSPNPYRQWKDGPSTNAEYFPLAVWLQSPGRAEQYRQAGFNLYVGLWRGPTEDQLAALKKAGMKVICHQNEIGRRHLNDPTIVGWMHGDEPDNAQSLGQGKGYGPPIPPAKIVEDYRKLRAADPTRPVLLNLGQAVAWDNWIGRGVRRNHPEDYAEYVKGCDITSFDIYPVVHESPEVSGKLWFVARGVERLVKWSGGSVVWNCLECTRISNVDRKPTPHQVRCEAWMSLAHGSRGLIYFVHQFKPLFREAALLDDAEMLTAVTALNHQITELAPVLHSPSIDNAARVKSSNDEVPIAFMVKRHQGSTYVFAVGMRDGKTTATFTLDGFTGDARVTVLGENRERTANQGVFSDTFAPWDVHLYQVRGPD